MTSNKAHSCYIIGGDTLLMECVEILLSRNFDVRGIISRNSRIEDWANKSNIPFLDLDSNYLSTLSKSPYDYLFSITHLEIIPDAVLQLPQEFSINFHDGPLPRYAGLNSPAWALMNNEDKYGITWHKIVPGVDEGDILLQDIFKLAADETSLSLNTRCFAAALETFPKLLDDLQNDDVLPQKQDLSSRSYFSRYQRPEAACVVDWTRPASELESQVRALDFGAYSNPLGSVKLFEGETAYIIQSAVAQSSESTPGKIGEIGEGEIEVGSGDGSLTITSFRTIAGESIAVSEVVKQLKLKPGKDLTVLAEDTRKKLTSLDSRLCRSEEFWTQRLMHLEPAELPCGSMDRGEKGNADFQSLDIDLNDDLNNDQKKSGAENLELIVCAFALLLARINNKETFDISFSEARLRQEFQGLEAIVSTAPVFRANLASDSSIETALDSVATELKLVRERNTWLKDLTHRRPELHEKSELCRDAILPIGIATENDSTHFVAPVGSLVTLVVAEDASDARFIFDQNCLSTTVAERLCRQFEIVYQSVIRKPDSTISDIRLLTDNEEQQILLDWNRTETDYPRHSCIHQLFEEQVSRTPESTALVFDDEELTYRELDRRANRLATELINKGVGPDVLVGVFVDRSLELMISTLGVLKAGGAYVPLDPAFPGGRIKYMIDDANLSVIVAQQQLTSRLPVNNAVTLELDTPEFLTLPCPEQAPSTSVKSSDLAYVIYTSGSTGQPKGVMVEHRNVGNFFTGMDVRIPHSPPGTWLAVTSLSFDISVLELFWTLARGFKVVIYLDRDRDNSGTDQNVPNSIRRRPMAFGLFMWGNDDAPGRAKYRLMLEGAKYFDENGFDSVWTPERHFHAFGGPYPNPAVTGAALAATTNNISIRSGSCVSPLHHPIRIAEDWAVIDNLSNGRVGLSFASGWQPNDFVIKPENHKNNKAIMLEQIETVRKLWRGEKVGFKNPMGEIVNIATLPRPVQKELPVWVTTAGNPETYKQAGALGANILTHLLGQTVDELAEKIKLYRDARKESGFDPDSGQVTLMLHTFVGEDNDTVRELVREPMKDYLRSAMKLVVDFAWSFPAFKRPGGADARVEDVDIKALTEEETETILDFAFERYFENSGLFGTPKTCVAMVNRCKQADIDEIACLLDYGVATDDVMASLPWLKQVRDTTNQSSIDESEFSFASRVSAHKVTHLQCTPSMARMLMLNTESRRALSQVDHLMIGGEALPASLAKDLVALQTSTLTNMYGPTETTIWSTTHLVTADLDAVPIGTPIANTRVYILDKYRQPVPPGVPGELFIGGDGVVRGYLNRPELTAERFIPDPFADTDNERIYWTGDIATHCEDGVIEFLGRIDHQVKIRGYRIELGEIESALDQHDEIRESVVLLREDTSGDQRLIAYYVARKNEPTAAGLRDHLRQSLPEHMIPSDFVALDALPLTPNRKVDRNALPSPQALQPEREQAYAPPESGLEEKIVKLWQNTLQVDKVGANDNFFDLGGHSLLIVRLHAEFREVLDEPVSLTDLYRFPTVRSLVDHLTSSGSAETLKKGSDRAQRRREMIKRRRKHA